MPPENDDLENDGNKGNTEDGVDESGNKPEGDKDLDDKGKGNTEADKDKPEGDKDKDEKVGAPETYEPYTMPEGVEMAEADTIEFNTLAKDYNLTQEQAQGLIDFESKRMASFNEDQVAENEKLVSGWLTTAKDDPEIGGANFDKTVSVANKALEKFGSPDLVKFLEDSGLGAHPEMIRSWNLVGKALSEDTVFSGNARGSDNRSVAQKMYPNQK